MCPHAVLTSSCSIRVRRPTAAAAAAAAVSTGAAARRRSLSSSRCPTPSLSCQALHIPRPAVSGTFSPHGTFRHEPGTEQHHSNAVSGGRRLPVRSWSAPAPAGRRAEPAGRPRPPLAHAPAGPPKDATFSEAFARSVSDWGCRDACPKSRHTKKV